MNGETAFKNEDKVNLIFTIVKDILENLKELKIIIYE